MLRPTNLIGALALLALLWALTSPEVGAAPPDPEAAPAHTVLVGSATLASGMTDTDLDLCLEQDPAVPGTPALQLDIVFDPAKLELVDLRPSLALQALLKELTWREVEPGRVRVVIIGPTNDLIENGTLATLELRCTDNLVAAGEEKVHPVALEGVILASVEGAALDVRVEAGAIQVLGS